MNAKILKNSKMGNLFKFKRTDLNNFTKAEIELILKMTVIEQNSDRVVVSNMASTLKDLIDGKCHAETSLEKFIYRKVSWYSKKAQTSDDDISWSHCVHFWPNLSEKIEIDQIKSAFVSKNQEQTSVDVEKISEKLMIMIKEQDQKYRNQQLLYFTFASCYGAYLLYTAYGAALLSLALDHVF